MKILTVITALSLPGAFCARAASDLQTSAYRNSIAQDEVRKQAEDVRQQLALLLEDIQQNQFDTPEADLARRAAAKLNSLGDEQIAPLIQMLKEAGAMDNAAQVQGKLSQASREQKNIQVLLKAMADGLSLHKDQASIQNRLQQLILRQTTNLRQTQDIAATGKPAEIASLCQSEQSALRQEVDLTFETLQKVVDNLPPDQKGRFSSALEVMKSQGVPALAATASAETTAGKFSDAVASQGRLKTALLAVLLSLKTNQSALEQAQAMGAKMKELAAEQKALAEATAKAPEAALSDLREAQRKVEDKLAAVQKEVQDINAGAAEESKKAAEAMKKAADDLKTEKKPKKDEVAAAQKNAAEKLEKAGEELAKSADRLAKDKAPQNAAQAAAELAQLSQKIAEAQAQQNAQAANPAANPAQPEKQAEKTRQLQQDALPTNAEAAKRLGEAASKMLENKPQEAAQALAQANAEVQKQMQAVAQAAAQEQQLQAVNKEIAEAKAAADAAQKSLQDTKPGQAQMDAIKKTEDAQKGLQEAQQAAASAGASADVKQALQKAQQSLEKSKMEAAQMKKDAAASANASAQKSMQGAMQALQQSMADALAKASSGQQKGNEPQSGPQMAQQQDGQQNNPPKDGQPGGGMGGLKGDDALKFIGNGGPKSPAGQVAVGLKPQDREAVALLQKEKAPSEYQGMAGQYLKNLAAGESPATPLR